MKPNLAINLLVQPSGYGDFVTVQYLMHFPGGIERFRECVAVGDRLIFESVDANGDNPVLRSFNMDRFMGFDVRTFDA